MMRSDVSIRSEYLSIISPTERKKAAGSTDMSPLDTVGTKAS